MRLAATEAAVEVRRLAHLVAQAAADEGQAAIERLRERWSDHEGPHRADRVAEPLGELEDEIALVDLLREVEEAANELGLGHRTA
ncbi:MAG: hypothetical protein JW751_32050 [Polyangiaceae bacterium]|nr:hypothetical protein [Polyangiaceae bacterium]